MRRIVLASVICVLVLGSVAWAIVSHGNQTSLPTVSEDGVPELLRVTIRSWFPEGANNIRWHQVRRNGEATLVFFSFGRRNPKAGLESYLGMALFEPQEKEPNASTGCGMVPMRRDSALTVLFDRLINTDPLVKDHSLGLYAGGYIRDRNVVRVIGWSATGERSESILQDGFFWVELRSPNQQIQWDKLEAVDAEGRVLYSQKAH